MFRSSSPASSVRRYAGWHCGVVGCCEGRKVDSHGWHGIGSACVVYTVRPCPERALMLTVRTGVFPPSVSWVGEEATVPSATEISWFQRRGPGEEDYVSTSSGLDAEDFYATLQAKHGVPLVPDEVVLDALLEDAATRWPGELVAASPALAPNPPPPTGGGRAPSRWYRFAAFFLAFGSMCSCAPAAAPDAPPVIVRATWRPMQPPRAGLRCWYSHSPAHGVSYCEHDPSSTYGASP